MITALTLALMSSAHAQGQDCKALYGLVIEGHAQETGGSDFGAHDVAKRWAETFAQMADHTSIVPPEGPITTTNVADLDTYRKFNQTVMSSGAQICEKAGPQFVDMLLGVAQKNQPVDEKEYLEYRRDQNKVADGKNVIIERPVLSSAAAMGKTTLADKIRALRGKCKGKSDQVVMVFLTDHGSKGCYFHLGEKKVLEAKDIKKNIIEPLMAAGARVQLHVDACYSGCFVDQLRSQKFSSPLCVMSTTRSDTVGIQAAREDQIPLYQVTYPSFLARLKNPLKAHICATLLDPANEPRVASPKARPSAATKPANLEQQLKERFGFSDVSKECTRPPESQTSEEGISPARWADLMKCETVKQIFTLAFGAEETKKLLTAIHNPLQGPGVKGLQDLLNESAGLESECSIDLSQYMSPEKQAAGVLKKTAETIK